MNDPDLCLEVVSRLQQPLRHIRRWISRKPLEILGLWFQRTSGPPTRNGLWGIKWSRDRWRHVKNSWHQYTLCAISRKQLEMLF